MSSPGVLPPAAVVEHAQSLRALAFALLRDVDAADDAVQETWLRALERRPERLERFGGWLRTVLVNVAINRRRSERRREERERVSARPESIEGTHERERALRLVVDAVLTLDEPYKSIVLLRYFENLAPREIAKRLNLPATVVHNRLHRAHARLRTRLEREDRDWAVALGLFAGIAPTGGALVPGGLSVGAALVTLKSLTAAAVVVILLGIAVWWRSARADVAPLESVASAVLAQIERVDSPAARIASANDGARVAAPDEPPRADPAVARGVELFTYEVEFLLTDEDDAPVSGGVLIAPERQPLDYAGDADFDGRFVARWRGSESAMELVVAANAHGEAAEMRRVRVLAGRRQQVALRCARPPDSLAPPAGERAMAPLERMLGEHAHGASFVDPWMARALERLDAAAVEPADLVRLKAVILELEGLKYSARAEWVFAKSVAIRNGWLTLSGSISHANGEPAGGVLVRARGGDGLYMVRSDAAGKYAFGDLPPGDYDVVAGDGSVGTARTAVHGEADDRVRWDAELERGRELRGRLVDPRGGVLARWFVELVRDGPDSAHADSAVTDEHGEFSMPSLPDGSFRLLARPAADVATPPSPVAPVVWPSIGVQEFVAPLERDHRLGSIRVEVRDERGAPLSEFEVRVWKHDVARGVWARRTGDGAIARADALLPGDYGVEIGAPGRAWLAIDHVFVPPGETIEVGPVRLAAPGRVELVGTVREDESNAQLTFRRRGAVDSVSSEFRPTGSDVFELPAGDYELTLTGDEPRVDVVTVVAGELVRVELGPR